MDGPKDKLRLVLREFASVIKMRIGRGPDGSVASDETHTTEVVLADG